MIRVVHPGSGSWVYPSRIKRSKRPRIRFRNTAETSKKNLFLFPCRFLLVYWLNSWILLLLFSSFNMFTNTLLMTIVFIWTLKLCVAGTVVNQIHADLKSEKSERGGADKEDRRRELNFPDRQVRPPPGIVSVILEKLGIRIRIQVALLALYQYGTVSPTVSGTRNLNRIRIQNQQNWQKFHKIKLISTFLDMHLPLHGSGWY